MSWLILQSSALAIPLADNSVQCVVTSPPYWGLRDYGTARWEGGDTDHSHDKIAARNGRGGSGSGAKQTPNAFPSYLPVDICSCGAIRIDNQIGLEKTPEEYVAKMVEVFREVRRVLRDDGTLWINLGSSYAGGGGFCETAPTTATSKSGKYGTSGAAMKSVGSVQGFKPKDMVPIPWMVAMALQADGWWLRSDIIWSKPNPMPESVTDRPTKAHEYVFLLSKSACYYFDQDAVREPGGFPTELSGRNIRTVWEIATQPFPEAHFATFPEKLASRCIKAGSRLGGIVLDPFAGAGTTCLVANRLGRAAVGVELKYAYCVMARRRIVRDAPILDWFNEQIKGG